MKRLIRIAAIPFIGVCIASCTVKSGTDQSSQSDSIPQPAAEEVRLTPLPDTVFPSALAVKNRIDVADSSISPNIDNLKDLFAESDNVMTFRRTLHRQGMTGSLPALPTRLTTAWRVDTELETKDTVYGPWYGGTGWTGQPLYVEWPDSVTGLLRQRGLVTSDFDGKEIISASLCGKLYFINPTTGKETRLPLDVRNPIKGTPTLDPTMNGFLYVGQGVPAQRPFGALVVDLFNNKILDFFPQDPKALRGWGAYDSSPVRLGQFLFRPGENGSVYKYLVEKEGIRLRSVARYTVKGAAPGIESSMAVYLNYGVTADNHGNVICFNLENMKAVWHYSLGDDTDATPLLTVEDGVPYVYVGCEVDRQPSQSARYVKLNVLDGTPAWERQYPAKRLERGKKHFDGGFYSSALPGGGDCGHLVFVNMVKNLSGQNGCLMALDRKTGDVAYEVPLNVYSWSSPVGFVTKAGEMVVVTGDCSGYIYAIEGKTGKLLVKERIGSNFESSPTVVGNSIIIGSRSNGIFKIILE